MMLTAILQILNIALPQIATLIVAIKGANGGASAVIYLDSADAQFAANQKQIQDWLAAKGKGPVA